MYTDDPIALYLQFIAIIQCHVSDSARNIIFCFVVEKFSWWGGVATSKVITIMTFSK